MKHKKELLVLSLIAITIIGILSGASYAYFQVQQKQGQETVIESGTMALTLEDGATITANNLIPGEYIEKEFTVKNTGTLKTGYDIYLSEVVNTFVNQSDLVYEIISSNGYNTSNQVQVPNTETKIINNYNINPLEEHKYILKITYKLTNENQNDNMGRTFIAKININEYNQNNSERYIKLYDASNNEIDKQVLTNNSDYYYPLSNINLSNSTNIYCDNGGIPTIENNQLKVSEVTSETICKISNSINTTINNLPNTKTGIVMTNNQDNVVPMTITSGKEVVLDLNGKEIKSIGVNETSTTYNINYIVFRVLGKILIDDTIGTGGIYTGTTSRDIIIGLNGTVIINGGSYNGRQSISLDGNNANLVINDGTFNSNMYAVVQIDNNNDNSKIIINDGNFLFNGIDGQTIIYINGKDTSSIDINGGNFVNNKGRILSTHNSQNSGVINVNGGIFTSSGKTIENNSGIINVNGGSFESTNGQTIYNNGGTIKVSSGYFESTNNISVENMLGTINISGGNFVSSIRSTIKNNNNGTININESATPVHIYNTSNSTNGSVAGIFDYYGTININSKIADKCTNNPNDTMSGLCVYSNTISVKNDRGIMNVNGGYYISAGSNQAFNNESGTVKIKDAYLYTYNNNAVYNGNYNPYYGTGVPGTIDICNTTLQSNRYDIWEANDSCYIKYYDVIFSSGTTTPDSNKIRGTIIETSDACSW